MLNGSSNNLPCYLEDNRESHNEIINLITLSYARKIYKNLLQFFVHVQPDNANKL